MKYQNNIGIGIIIVSLICAFLIVLPREKNGVVLKYVLDLKPLNKVSLTTYTTDTAQTDSFPLITASGLHLDSANPKKSRIIAISRDLQK